MSQKMDVAAAAPNRTRLVLKQSALGLIYRLGAVGASFAMMPVMLRQLGPQEMGAWLVLLSVFQWITFFDLGVAAGARNEIARAVANHDVAHTRRAVTTGWYYTMLITAVLAGLIAVILALLPVSEWLETAAFGGIDAGGALWVVSLGSCLSFALSYVQIVFAAHQRASAISIFSLLSNFGFLLLLFAVQPGEGSGLIRMSWLYLAAMVGANVWLIFRFFRRHPELLPSIEAVDNSLRSRIMGFGIRLFVIQLAAMIIFTTARLMVSLFVGPAEVVIYDAGFKVFSIVTMVHGLLMTTLWSSFTHAYEQNDWNWLQATLRRLMLLMIPLGFGCVVLAFASPWLIAIWLGQGLVGNLAMYGWFAVVIVLSCWSNIFAYFLNGVGDVKLQFYSAIVAAVINLPLSYYFAVMLKMGASGVLVGTVCSSAIFSVLGPWRVFNFIKEMKSND